MLREDLRRSAAAAGVCALLALGLAPARARAGQRALVVGIDTYSPPAGKSPTHRGRSGWMDLRGAAADAGAIDALLRARYGFQGTDIRLLQNRAATRQAILDGLTEFLGGAAAGDTAFFYYAGHGSQVTNSRSPERNKRDESLVPTDSWQGQADIRDKELDRAFTAILDKGVRLVVVFDSCHSGSASRGPAGAADSAAGLRARRMHPSVLDAADPHVPASRKGRDFLAISAAQDFQLAWEAWGDDGLPRGLFSLALQRAMQTSPPDEPVERLFKRVQSAVATARDDQDPVLEGDPERLAQPLFARPQTDADPAAARTVVGVVGETVKGVELGAGSVVGLTPGAELVPYGDGGPKGLRLRVTEVLGPGLSRATVVAGRSNDIRGGLLLSVDTWGPPTPSALRLHIPAAGLSAAQLRDSAATFRTWRPPTVTWIDDPTATPGPTHTLSRRGDAWVLESAQGAKPVRGRPDLQALPEGARLFVNLPPSRELASVLELPRRAAKAPADRAHYHLAARWSAGRLEYAWVRPWGPAETSHTPLPARTDWQPATGPSHSAAALKRHALRLATVHHWLTTDGPPADGRFPYRLAIFDADTPDKRRAYKVDGAVHQGTRYNLALVATRPLGGGGWVKPRYVYVFVLDRDGASTLLLPYPGKGDVENLFPPAHDRYPRSVYKLLDQDVAWVAPPFGTDTYVLLTTKTKLPDPHILEGDGVRTRGAALPASTPSDWSIRRVTVRSAPAP